MLKLQNQGAGPSFPLFWKDLGIRGGSVPCKHREVEVVDTFNPFVIDIGMDVRYKLHLGDLDYIDDFQKKRKYPMYSDVVKEWKRLWWLMARARSRRSYSLKTRPASRFLASSHHHLPNPLGAAASRHDLITGP